MKLNDRVEVAWLDQPGRLASRTGSAADGFRGTGAIAGVTVVAEGPPSSQHMVRNAVDCIRDAFAEGVAYGAGDVLEDSFQRLRSDIPLKCISIAAAAVLGSDVWVRSRGGCMAFIAGRRVSGQRREDATPVAGHVAHLVLEPGQAVILVTGGLAGLVRSRVADIHSERCRKPLEDCLAEMVRETGIRFRQTGASAAAVRFCRVAPGLPAVFNRKTVLSLLVLILGIAAASVLCDSGVEGDLPADDGGAVHPETVMPLDPD